MEQYRHELAEWNSLSAEERASRNSDKENASVRSSAGWLGFFIGGALFYFFVMRNASENIEPGAESMLIFLPLVLPLVFMRVPLIRQVGGKLWRVILYSAVASIFIMIGTLVVSFFAEVVDTHYWRIAYWAMGIVAAIIGWNEMTGRNHESAAPTKPSTPSA